MPSPESTPGKRNAISPFACFLDESRKDFVWGVWGLNTAWGMGSPSLHPSFAHSFTPLSSPSENWRRKLPRPRWSHSGQTQNKQSWGYEPAEELSNTHKRFLPRAHTESACAPMSCLVCMVRKCRQTLVWLWCSFKAFAPNSLQGTSMTRGPCLGAACADFSLMSLKSFPHLSPS